MEPIAGDLLLDYRTILAPFALMTSCATLVWGLQSRYSRVVQAIRSLSQDLREAANPPARDALSRQLEILRRRAFLLRNGVVGHYLAMIFFLVTAVLLTMGMSFEMPSAVPVIVSFFAGLVLVCWTMANSFFDSLRSWDAVGEELRLRAKRSTNPIADDQTGECFAPFR